MHSTVSQQPMVIIAPIALQQALLVLLRAQGLLEPILCVATVQNLPVTVVPHILIYIMHKEADAADVQLMKQRWPTAGLLVLVAEPEQQASAQAAGADASLPQGVSPHKLREVVAALNERAT